MIFIPRINIIHVIMCLSVCTVCTVCVCVRVCVCVLFMHWGYSVVSALGWVCIFCGLCQILFM